MAFGYELREMTEPEDGVPGPVTALAVITDATRPGQVLRKELRVAPARVREMRTQAGGNQKVYDQLLSAELEERARDVHDHWLEKTANQPPPPRKFDRHAVEKRFGRSAFKNVRSHKERGTSEADRHGPRDDKERRRASGERPAKDSR
jgi:hypothetical protein